MKKIQLITDGACLGNPGPGGWASILRYNDHTRELTGSVEHTTNNRMELTGVIEGDADPQQFIPELAELWRDGQFPIDRLVKRFPFAELNAAISALAGGEVIKPVVVFE